MSSRLFYRKSNVEYSFRHNTVHLVTTIDKIIHNLKKNFHFYNKNFNKFRISLAKFLQANSF